MEVAETKHGAIPMVVVESNQLLAVGHDPAREVLAVQFKHGQSVYHYSGVTKELHQAFMSSESKGAFFARHIKALVFEKFPAPDPKVQHLPSDDSEGGNP